MDIYRSLLDIHLSQKKFEESLAVLSKLAKLFTTMEQPHNVQKTLASLVVLHLTRDDIVSAQRTFAESSDQCNFANSDVGEGINKLLSAYQRKDSDSFDKAKNAPILKYLEVPVRRKISFFFATLFIFSEKGGETDEGNVCDRRSTE